MSENNIASAEDFKKAAEASRFEEALRVILPKSGLAVKLRRPKPIWMLFHGRLPSSLAARVSESGGVKPETAHELADLARWMTTLLTEVFVEPRLGSPAVPAVPSHGPPARAAEIDPAWLDQEDVNFVIRWAGGEVEPDGASLAPFRRERGTAPAGAGSGNLSRSPELVDGADGRDGAAV